ncbi:DUF1002 domain-containing protein [Weissella halotolerans]|uniref:DUF1002 domain-containing protein n=1 Tax=Weissella halotolerans DSM 20190 TaxID=1123500 RepID=A0A0R2FSF8_9LACO|nr:DUF1002 domain-containing protein [Weissella halotolerans]KRN31248.1 hypothetical protein IV68_GL001131 [Weissella halotolerans DSM 20190]
MTIRILLATMVGLTALISSMYVQVANAAQTQAEQNRPLSQPYVVYGAAAQQKHQVAQTLGVTAKYATLTTTGADARYIGLSGISDEAMISSVALAPAEPGTGTLVNIEPFEGQNNILQVKSQQYAMAATMAGVKDVIITVTANKPVSGEAALAGVYKALDQDGIPLDDQNTAAANNVLSATSGAIQDNADDKKYPGKLTAAVTETAGDLAKEKQAGNPITINIIIDQLTINLRKQGIEKQTSSVAVQNISQALSEVNAAPISDSKGFIKNTGHLSDTLQDSAGDVMAKVKDFANSADAKEATNWFMINIWEPVKQFLANLF